MGVGDGGEGRGGVWDEGRGARAGVRRAKVRPGVEGQGPWQGSEVSGRSGGPEARSGVRRERGCRSRLRDRGPGSRRRLRRVRVLGGGRQAVGIPQSSGDASQPRPPRPFAALRRALDRAAALASSGRPPSLRPRPRGHSAPNSTASALRRSGPVAATGSLRKAGQVAGASGLQRRAGTAASGFPAPAARSQGPWKHLLPLQQRSIINFFPTAYSNCKFPFNSISSVASAPNMELELTTPRSRVTCCLDSASQGQMYSE
ncbi:uncharacterized protein LOC131816209 isoform X1 [Mustela lutreola]|uniref:uncharacterized protein LOC131816209 isoform X1 n=1 Tax=Mustela lutreola TaxID=9666 RepID=UPI002797BD5E|nr:uncharacterized protein LOC131816209 isoform X1 [Mustela lutreola]